jgi:hypothetical protein
VGREKFSFESIEPLEDRIRRLDQDAAYIQIWDRTDRSNEQNLGRFDLTETDALPYLDERHQVPPDDDEPADPYEGSFGEYDHDEEPEDDEPPPRRRAGAMPTPREIAEAACRWLRELAVGNTVGEAWCRYRVKVYGPKGVRVVAAHSVLQWCAHAVFQ